MECPRTLEDTTKVINAHDSACWVDKEGGGIWIEAAELIQHLLHNGLPVLDEIGGKPDPDEFLGFCPTDDVELATIRGGPKDAPLFYGYCEVCGHVWIDMDIDPDATFDQAIVEIIAFFKTFRRPLPARR